jgi:hypothetical protein
VVLAEDYESVLRNLGTEYFIQNLQFVPDLLSWGKNQNVGLSEPRQLMKLVPAGTELTMVIQSEIPEDMLDSIITNLSVRWSLKDNVDYISKTLNSIKKRMVFAFLKEYARTARNVGGDELIEDEWAIQAMEKLGFFRE